MKNETQIQVLGGVFVLVVVVAALGAGALWNDWLHNDWTCVFKTCVTVEEKR